MKTIQIRWSWLVGCCWWSKDKLISDVLRQTPSYRQAKVGWSARTYIQQLCADKGCSLEDLPGVMDNRDRWRERVREMLAAWRGASTNGKLTGISVLNSKGIILNKINMSIIWYIVEISNDDSRKKMTIMYTENPHIYLDVTFVWTSLTKKNILSFVCLLFVC